MEDPWLGDRLAVAEKEKVVQGADAMDKEGFPLFLAPSDVLQKNLLL